MLREIYKVWEVPDEQTNSEQGSGTNPVLSPTGNVVTLTLTDTEFIEFLSALEIGSEIIYPDKFHEMSDKFILGLQ